MEKHNQLRSLLVEILIAVLFFALSATVLLEVFVGAHGKSDRAAAMNGALFAAQNLADTLCCAEDAAALLAREGFTEREDGWTRESGAYALTVTLGEERLAGGTMRRATVRAQYGGETILTLPCARYQPEEVTP